MWILAHPPHTGLEGLEHQAANSERHSISPASGPLGASKGVGAVPRRAAFYVSGAHTALLHASSLIMGFPASRAKHTGHSEGPAPETQNMVQCTLDLPSPPHAVTTRLDMLSPFDAAPPVAKQYLSLALEFPKNVSLQGYFQKMQH